MQLTHSTPPALREAAAARIVDSGSTLRSAWLGITAGFRLLLDPDDTRQVFVIATVVDRPRLRRMVERLEQLPEGRALLAERPAIDSKSVDYARLRRLPEHTLGGAYARMLEREGLDPDLFQPPPLLAPELAYVAQRIRQTHDIWHVITGLSTDVPGEVALQAFTNGQLHNRTSRLIVTFGTLFYGMRYRNLRRRARAFKRAGLRSQFLLAVRWEELWEEPLDALRARLGVELPA